MYGQRYHLDADEGYLNADVTDDGSTYRISYYGIHTRYQGSGYGKELLAVAREHAKLIGAQVITSSNITSDELAGAMSAVFGYEHLSARTDPRTVTSLVELFSEIKLHYEIQDSDPDLRSGVELLPGTRPPSTSPIYTYWNSRHT